MCTLDNLSESSARDSDDRLKTKLESYFYNYKMSVNCDKLLKEHLFTIRLFKN